MPHYRNSAHYTTIELFVQCFVLWSSLITNAETDVDNSGVRGITMILCCQFSPSNHFCTRENVASELGMKYM